ncbi:hypothetical protein EGW08_007989, partial [Elysia chlorotica]
MKKSTHQSKQAGPDPLPPYTPDELKDRVLRMQFPPKVFPEPVPDSRRGTLGLCPASTWDCTKVCKWAESKGLPEVARVARAQGITGDQLLRTDALTLQRLGVSRGGEVLLAEEYICRLAREVDHNASDDTGFPVEMHKSIYR